MSTKTKIEELQEITELRNYYHSINLDETSQAITALKNLKNVDASRELIQLYEDSLWRKIKIEIISALGVHANQRSLEFLFEIAKSDYDLSLASYAIEALGQSNHLLAGRFLNELYENGHATKKPMVVLALVKLTHTASLSLFEKDLAQALENNDFSLAKNIIYALGELRSHTSLSQLKNILAGHYPKEIQLSAMTSLGKIGRNPSELEKYADKYRHDAFEFQIFQQAQNQLHFRADWKLEDYLNKLFQSNNSHKNLPLELNSFAENDVFAGLEMFAEEKNLKKIADTLSLLNFKNVLNWYDLLLKDRTELVAQSLRHHSSENIRAWLEKIKAQDVSTACQIAVTSLPQADQYFKDLISSDEYKSAEDSLKISIINSVVDLALLQSSNSKMPASLSKFLENEIQIENSWDVKGRILRALAQTKMPQNKILSILKTWIKSDVAQGTLLNLNKNILFYLEHHPTHQSFSFLKEHLIYFENQKGLLPHLLRALEAQDADQFKTAEIKNIIQISLNASQDSDVKSLALRFLSKSEAKNFKSDIAKFLKDSSVQVVLSAIIAMKKIPDEDVPDLLQPLLSSNSESIKGRSLDAILNNSHLRAKRIAIDFLKDNINHIDCSEKIIRHLLSASSASQAKSDYFYNTVTQIIKTHPQHSLIESLIELQNHFQNELNEAQTRNVPSAADLVAIDKEISSRLPKFGSYDETIKASLRSAEVPFNKPELFDNYVDKSVCILGFTKAIDIFLEKYFGKKNLLPKVESRLHEFQNVIYLAHLNEDYPDVQQLLKALALEKHFTAHSLPVHKMTLIAKGILSAKIVNEQFKILDGLRAWAIAFLIFARSHAVTPKPMVSLALDESQTIDIAKKLMWLQDLRNPLAHRHTLTKLEDIKEIRTESYRILNLLEKTFM